MVDPKMEMNSKNLVKMQAFFLIGKQKIYQPVQLRKGGACRVH